MNPPSPPNNRSTEIFPVQGLDSVSPEDELLVAYLDGELEDAAKVSLEKQLSSDQGLRSRLDQLRSAWDLLDELPVTKPDPNFAQSTIEMVAMSAAQIDGSSRFKGRGARLWLAAWLTLPLLMIVGGYLSVRAWYRYQERLAIQEVHLLADWDALKAVGSYEWLEKLTTVKDLHRVSKRTSTSELGVGVVPKTIAERRSWIAELSPTDRDRLSANLEDFKEFKQARPGAELNKIVELGNRIYANQDPESLLQVARSYAIFLSDMSVTDRATHLDITDLDTRVAELQRRVNRKLVEVYANDLPADSPDKRAVAEWKENMELEPALFGSTVEETFQDLQSRLQFSKQLDQLISTMTPEAQEIFGRLNDKSIQHLTLIWYFINPKPPRKQLDRTQAISEFENKPAEEQAQLEFLPPDEAQTRLGVK